MSAKRLRRLLGRCDYCWRRSVAEAEVRGLDAAGQPETPTTRIDICQKHVDKWMRTLLPISDEVDVEYESGMKLHMGQGRRVTSVPVPRSREDAVARAADRCRTCRGYGWVSRSMKDGRLYPATDPAKAPPGPPGPPSIPCPDCTAESSRG